MPTFVTRYKGRLYDSCITLDSTSGMPWCSIKTDEDNNHLGETEFCPETCPVNDCPLGYYRNYPDKSCIKVGNRKRPCQHAHQSIIFFLDDAIP